MKLSLRHIAFTSSAAISALLPLIILFLSHGPLQLGKLKFWIRIDSSISIDLPDGSGFRILGSCPTPLFFSACIALPVWWFSQRVRRCEREGTAHSARRLKLLNWLAVLWVLCALMLLFPPEARGFFILFILCIAALVAAIAGVSRWIGDYPRRKRNKLIMCGLCPHCGYDLYGNVSGVCPECGTPVTR